MNFLGWWKYSIIWLWWWVVYTTIHFPKLTEFYISGRWNIIILNYISMNFYTEGIYQLDPWQRWVWKDGLVFQFLSRNGRDTVFIFQAFNKASGTASCHCHGTLFTRTHRSALTSFCPRCIQSLGSHRHLSGGYQVSVMPSRETSNICNVSGGPGMSAARQR